MGQTKKEKVIAAIKKIEREGTEEKAEERYRVLHKALAALNLADTLLESIEFSKEEPSVEWSTPQEYVDRARRVLGEIDLDPATNLMAQKWIRAKKYYTKEEDGLKQAWLGKVWCNPPYGKYTKQFLKKGLDCYNKGEIESGIFLVNRTGAAWYQKMLPEFVMRCQVKHRISFISSKEIQDNSPRHYNDFLYLGDDPERFKVYFSCLGKIN